MLTSGGAKLEGEDVFMPAHGEILPQGARDEFAARFHLHPSVKASRHQDGHGAMLVLPNKDVWTFNSHEDRVETGGKRLSRRPRGAAACGADRDLRTRTPGAAGALDLHAYATPRREKGERRHSQGHSAKRAGITPVSQFRSRARPAIHPSHEDGSRSALHDRARMRRITRALISVSDKSGLIEFASGTCRARRRAGLHRRHRQGADGCGPQGASMFRNSPAFPK